MKESETIETTSLRIKNFRSLEDVKIKLRKFTLLLGPNGSGKSSVLKAINFMKLNLDKPDIYKTKYLTENNENYGSFKDIVFNNNVNNKVQFELSFGSYRKSSENTVASDKKFANVTMELEKNRKGNNISLIKISLPEYGLRISSFPNIHRKASIINECMRAATKRIKNIDNFKGKLKSYCPSEDNEKERVKNGYKHSSIYKLILYKLEGEFHSFFVRKSGNGFIFNSQGAPNDKIFPEREFRFYDDDLINKELTPLFKLWDILPFFNEAVDIEKSPISSILCEEKYLKHLESLQKIYDIFYSLIPSITQKFIYSQYFSAVREIPARSYSLKNNKFNPDDYYSILCDLDKKDVINETLGNIIPDEQISEYLTESLNFFNFAKSYSIQKSGSKGFIQLVDKNNVKFNLADGSSGLIQLFPIIVRSFNPELWSNINFIIIEQPELHLHPKLQSQLLEFFNQSNNHYILETHSEHMIRKLQVMIAKGELNKDDVAIYFFEKDNSTSKSKVKLIEIDDSGFLKEPFPDGFFDTSYNLSKELIFANKN